MGNNLSNPFAAAQRTTSQTSIGTTESSPIAAQNNRSTSTPTAAQREPISTVLSFFRPEILDTRETLRRLVTKTSIRGFDYGSKQFRFRTVFHQSSYSYCCCACAYEHDMFATFPTRARSMKKCTIE